MFLYFRISFYNNALGHTAYTTLYRRILLLLPSPCCCSIRMRSTVSSANCRAKQRMMGCLEWTPWKQLTRWHTRRRWRWWKIYAVWWSDQYFFTFVSYCRILHLPSPSTSLSCCCSIPAWSTFSSAHRRTMARWVDTMSMAEVIDLRRSMTWLVFCFVLDNVFLLYVTALPPHTYPKKVRVGDFFSERQILVHFFISSSSSSYDGALSDHGHRNDGLRRDDGGGERFTPFDDLTGTFCFVLDDVFLTCISSVLCPPHIYG